METGKIITIGVILIVYNLKRNISCLLQIICFTHYIHISAIIFIFNLDIKYPLQNESLILDPVDFAAESQPQEHPFPIIKCMAGV